MERAGIRGYLLAFALIALASLLLVRWLDRTGVTATSFAPAVVNGGRVAAIPAGDTLAVPGSLSFTQLFTLNPGTEVIDAPAGPTLNDYNPWGSSARTTRLEVDLTATSGNDVLTITGITAGEDGDELLIWNGGDAPCVSPCTITLANDSSASAALNRLHLPQGKEIVVGYQDGARLVYLGGFGWSLFTGSITMVVAQELSTPPARATLAAGSTTNDWNPWSGTEVTSLVYVSVTGSGTATVSGVVAAGAPNSDGRRVTIVNVSASNTFAVENLGAGSSPANQVATPSGSTITVPAGGSVELSYDDSGPIYRTSALAL
jgi:hypothetical protein